MERQDDIALNGIADERAGQPIVRIKLYEL